MEKQGYYLGRMIVRVSIVLIILTVNEYFGKTAAIEISSCCFGCLCEVVSRGACFSGIGCDQHGRCGPFRINWNYWVKAGRITLENDRNPIGAWTRCVDDLQCASRVIQGYMKEYAKDCNGDNIVDCYDIAQIHHFGGCSLLSNLDYYKNFPFCFDNRGNTKSSISNVQIGKNELSSNKLIPISDKCFTCICKASSGGLCPEETSCEKRRCGRFRINENYWIKAGNITLNSDNPDAIGAFERCATDTECASQTVQSYMDKFAWDCDGNGAIDCTDYARIHHLGGCEGKMSTTYETKFNECVDHFDHKNVSESSKSLSRDVKQQYRCWRCISK